MNCRKSFNAGLSGTTNHTESFADVKTGRTEPFVMDDPLLYGAKVKEAGACSRFASIAQRGDVP